VARVSTLWGKLRRTPALEAEQRAITSLDDYAAALSQANAYIQPGPAITQTMPGEQGHERPPADFRGMANEMFGSSSVVFACMLARFSVFSAIRFQYQRYRGGRPTELFGDRSLQILETPWSGGTTADLLARMIIDSDLCGNAYIIVDRGELVRLRPDWVDIILEPRTRLAEDGETVLTLGWRKIGYVYYEDGNRSDIGVILLPSEVAHFAPIPDPQASYRGMSWLTPLVREVRADQAMTNYKDRFVRNSATPNLVVKHAPQVTPDQAREFKRALDVEYGGPENAGKTMHIGGGADLTVVGKDLQQIDLRGVQGAGETRIAAAAGTPPIIVGLSEGLASATYSNYGQARRRFADGTMHPLWTNVAGSLSRIVPPPPASRLWYDARDVPFLREDSADQAKITATNAQSIRNMVDAGFDPTSVLLFVASGDVSALVHTGRVSVQLQKPGEGEGSDAEPDDDDDDSDSTDTDGADSAATNGRAFAPIPRELLTHG
jgi:hypothetical protein